MRYDTCTVNPFIYSISIYLSILLCIRSRCAVLFCDALYRNRPLPCKSAEEFIG